MANVNIARARIRALAALVVVCCMAVVAFILAQFVMQDTGGPVVRAIAAPWLGPPLNTIPATAIDPQANCLLVASLYGPYADGLVLDTRDGARVIPAHRALRPPVPRAWPAALAVDPHAGLGFVALQRPNEVLVKSLGTGAQRTILPTRASPTSLAVGGGRIYVASSASSPGCAQPSCATAAGIEVYDERIGRLLQRWPVPGAHQTMAALDLPAHRLVVAGRALTSSAGSVDIFDTTTGKLITHTVLHDLQGGLPVVDSRRGLAFVVMTGTTAGVATFDDRTGALLRVTPFGVQARIDLLLSESTGQVYAAALDGHGLWRLEAIDERTGRATPVISFPRAIGTELALGTDDRRGMLFVAFTQEMALPNSVAVAGTLRVLDARTGHVRRTFPLGFGTVRMAVDLVAGRLLLLTTGGIGFGPPPDRWGWLPTWLRAHIPFIPPPPGNTLQSGNRIIVMDTGRL